MDYVRRHLDQTLTLPEVAKRAHASPHHFHRMFKAVAGETLAQFTRRARLERAVYLMKAAPQRQLTSIALEVGFASSSEFSRVFKRAFGVAPRQWDRASRLGDPSLYDREAIAPDESLEPFVTTTRHDAAFRFAYVRVTAPFVTDALQVGYRVLTEQLRIAGQDVKTLPLLGMSWDNYETTPIERVRFDLGFAVGPQVLPKGELTIAEVPALQCVRARAAGPLLRIARAWDFLYETWIPASGFEPDDYPAMKRFNRRPDEIGWERWDVDCCIPIRPLLG